MIYPRNSPNGGPDCTCDPHIGDAMRCHEHFMVATDDHLTCELCQQVKSRCHEHTCPQDHACGRMCHKHFDADDKRFWETLSCPDCLEANRKAAADIQANHTIDPSVPYGVHVVLTCVNHTELRWTTKNIDFIGARSIFYSTRDQAECDCPMSDLCLLAC